MTRLITAFAVSALASVSQAADAIGDPVSVTFRIPGREPVRVEVTYDEAARLTGQKLPYMVAFWVHGALAKANVSYRDEVVEARTGARAIVAISDVANGPTGRWVYYVNGVRSPYHINTQTSEAVRDIRFEFESGSKAGQHPSGQ